MGRENNATSLGIMTYLKLRNKDQERQGREKMSYSKQTKPIMNTGCMSDVYDEVDIKSWG